MLLEVVLDLLVIEERAFLLIAIALVEYEDDGAWVFEREAALRTGRRLFLSIVWFFCRIQFLSDKIMI